MKWKWVDSIASVITLVKFIWPTVNLGTVILAVWSLIDLGQKGLQYGLQLILIGLIILFNILIFSLYLRQRSLWKNPLIIISAEWDADGPKPKDVTRIARSLVKEGALKIDKGRYNHFFGDPAPGLEGKKFHAVYLYRGEVTTDENEPLMLP